MILPLSNIIDRVRLSFRKDKEPYLIFYRILGFYPHDIRLYETALLHRSLAVKEEGQWIHNERLEFLGDAVLDATVAEILYRRFPRRREGFLTSMRAKIVQRDTLNQIAEAIGLDKLVKASMRGASHNSYVSGNALEAFVGAIYLDRGYDACRYFMEHRIIDRYLNLGKLSHQEVNFKSKLLEWAQRHHVTVMFQLTEEGKDKGKSPVFGYQVLLNGAVAGEGKGYSKKEAQQKAAQEAMEKIKSQSLTF